MENRGKKRNYLIDQQSRDLDTREPGKTNIMEISKRV